MWWVRILIIVLIWQWLLSVLLVVNICVCISKSICIWIVVLRSTASHNILFICRLVILAASFVINILSFRFIGARCITSTTAIIIFNYFSFLLCYFLCSIWTDFFNNYCLLSSFDSNFLVVTTIFKTYETHTRKDDEADH